MADGDSIIRAAFTERGLRRLAAALTDRRTFSDARLSWLRSELARLSNRAGSANAPARIEAKYPSFPWRRFSQTSSVDAFLYGWLAGMPDRRSASRRLGSQAAGRDDSAAAIGRTPAPATVGGPIVTGKALRA